MHNKRIILSLLIFLTTGAVTVRAENAPAAPKPAAESIVVPPANMNDEALASYISGRLAPLLRNNGYKVSQNCDASGCSVLVQ